MFLKLKKIKILKITNIYKKKYVSKHIGLLVESGIDLQMNKLQRKITFFGYQLFLIFFN